MVRSLHNFENKFRAHSHGEHYIPSRMRERLIDIANVSTTVSSPSGSYRDLEYIRKIRKKNLTGQPSTVSAMEQRRSRRMLNPVLPQSSRTSRTIAPQIKSPNQTCAYCYWVGHQMWKSSGAVRSAYFGVPQSYLHLDSTSSNLMPKLPLKCRLSSVQTKSTTTEKLAELSGGNRHLDGDNTVNASASIQGHMVDLNAPTIDKVFEGDCGSGSCPYSS